MTTCCTFMPLAQCMCTCMTVTKGTIYQSCLSLCSSVQKRILVFYNFSQKLSRSRGWKKVYLWAWEVVSTEDPTSLAGNNTSHKRSTPYGMGLIKRRLIQPWCLITGSCFFFIRSNTNQLVLMKRTLTTMGYKSLVYTSKRQKPVQVQLVYRIFSRQPMNLSSRTNL